MNEVKKLNADKEGNYASNNFASTGSAGAITTRGIYIGIEVGNSEVVLIGGISDGSINMDKKTIPVQELGSDETIIVPGRSSPFQMSLQKMYVNGYNLLKSLIPEKEFMAKYADKKSSPKFMMDMSNALLKKPRDYVILMVQELNGVDDSRFISYAKGVTIQSYNFSISADSEIAMEGVQMMGSFFKDGGES